MTITNHSGVKTTKIPLRMNMYKEAYCISVFTITG